MPPLYPESEFVVTVTSDFVRVEHPSITTQNIFWSDLNEVSIITTDEGPLNPDVWLVLKGDVGGCRIPQGCTGYDSVYDIVSAYDGFDFDEVIKAMTSTDNNEFLLWQRK